VFELRSFWFVRNAFILHRDRYLGKRRRREPVAGRNISDYSQIWT
jgi:hypothetical protein